MAISFKVEGVPILAIRDRAMFNTFANGQSYVIKDIGDELAITSSSTSFSVSLGSGEAVICGGSMTCEGNDDTLILGANESGYIVIRVDLSQTGTNVCRLARVSTLVQGNINNGDEVFDFPLYSYITNTNGVSRLTDIRKITTSPNEDKLNKNGVQTFDVSDTTFDVDGASFDVSALNNIVKLNGVKLDGTNLGEAFNGMPNVKNGVDLNTIRTSGVYQVIGGSTALNFPQGATGLLVVYKYTDSFVRQDYTNIATSTVYTNTNYSRAWSSTNGWSEWKRTATQSGDIANNSLVASNGNGAIKDSGFTTNNLRSLLNTKLDLSSVLFFGDSFTEGYLLTNPATENWAVRLANLLKLNKYQRYYCGGAGFVKVSSSHNMTFAQYWDTIVDSLNDDITTIFIMGGINDKSYNETQIVNAISSFNTKIRQKFNANQTRIVYLFNPLPQVCLNTVINACYNGAINQSWITIDSWWWEIFRTSYYQQDATHPNSNGAYNIARCVQTCLMGGRPVNRTKLELASTNNVLYLWTNNEQVSLFVNFTPSTTTRTEKIGSFPDFLSKHWNSSSRKSPQQFYREMCTLGNDGKNFGYIFFGGGTAQEIYLGKMLQLGATNTWSTGVCVFEKTYDLLSFLG